MMSLSLISCNLNNNLKKEITEFYATSIELAVDSLFRYTYNFHDSLLFDNNYKTLVVYHDSMTCGVCESRKLHFWQTLLSSIDSLNNHYPFNVLFIFTPQQDQTTSLKVMLKNVEMDYPIIIDEKHLFSSQNKHIPQNPLLHTFLLNEDKKVILVGDILYNTNVRKLFLDQIGKKE